MQLEITDLTRTFKDAAAVDHISCTLGNGVYGLLGVNGAGKTTFMRMLCTLLLPTSGSICLEGTNIFSMDGAYRRLLGYLPQDFGFYPDFTIQDYLLYIASIKGLRPAYARKRAELLLHQMGLWDVRKKKMKKLSGGMKRRAGIAQAMLNDPQILILDEPTAGLDPGERIRFRNLISEIADRRLVLLSTHIVSDIEYIAGEILLMKNGKLMLTGLMRAFDYIPALIVCMIAMGALELLFFLFYNLFLNFHSCDFLDSRGSNLLFFGFSENAVDRKDKQNKDYSYRNNNPYDSFSVAGGRTLAQFVCAEFFVFAFEYYVAPLF